MYSDISMDIYNKIVWFPYNYYWNEEYQKRHEKNRLDFIKCIAGVNCPRRKIEKISPIISIPSIPSILSIKSIPTIQSISKYHYVNIKPIIDSYNKILTDFQEAIRNMNDAYIKFRHSILDLKNQNTMIQSWYDNLKTSLANYQPIEFTPSNIQLDEYTVPVLPILSEIFELMQNNIKSVTDTIKYIAEHPIKPIDINELYSNA